jgi:hypothetical protein
MVWRIGTSSSSSIIDWKLKLVYYWVAVRWIKV